MRGELQLNLDRIAEGAAALTGFVDVFRTVDEADTSPHERAQIARAAELVEQALDQFS